MRPAQYRELSDCQRSRLLSQLSSFSCYGVKCKQCPFQMQEIGYYKNGIGKPHETLCALVYMQAIELSHTDPDNWSVS